MTNVNETKQSQIENLATLLVLDEEIRKLSNVREFGFFSTNETHRLIPYHTAYMWELKELIGTHIIAQSGTAEIDIQAPANQWVKNKINEIRLSPRAKEIHQIEYKPAESDSSVDWSDDLPHNLLWCPLLNKSNQIVAGLLFFRENTFTESEVKMMKWLVASYQYAWLTIAKPRKIPTWDKLKEKPIFIAISIVIAGILLFPVQLSVLGEGTIVPKSPALINAPMQGVIESFAVSPGQTVKKGQLLLSLDKTDLQTTVEVNKKDYSLTQAKLRTAINEGFENKDSRAEVPILQAQLAIDKARLDYANEMLTKADIRSPSDGIVIFDSREDWLGQPVRTGERILFVADPTQVQLKIIIPVANSIQLALNDKGEFFLFGELNPLSFHLTTLGYNAKLMPNKTLAYELIGDFKKIKKAPQLGAQGTVKIYGSYVPLIYYILKRPLQAIRQTVGI